MTDAERAIRRCGFGWDALLYLLAAFLLFWGLGNRGLWVAEGRWAVIAREMLSSGDFFHPTINGEPYFDKPLLTYWWILAASFLTGGVNEWAVRLPSALSGFAAILCTARLGRRLWSSEVGRTAGWLLLSTYGFLFWARVGTAEMENLAAVVLAVTWYWARRDRPDFVTCLVFYLIAFLGSHNKGLGAAVVPALVLLPDLLFDGRWRILLRPAHLLALVLGIVVYLAPFLIASATRSDYGATGLDLVFQENIRRYYDPFDHTAPFFMYFLWLPALLLPWTPLYLASLASLLPSWKSLDRSTRWLAVAMMLIFAFYTLSGSRRSYYILPILPFCSLWISVFLHREGAESRIPWKRWALVTVEVAFLVLAVGALASPIFRPLVEGRTGFIPPAELQIALVASGVLCLLVWVFSRWKKDIWGRVTGLEPGIAPLGVMALVILGSYFCWQQGVLEVYRTEKNFSLALRQIIKDISPGNIGFYRKHATNVLFYLDPPRPVAVLADADMVKRFIYSDIQDKFLVSRRGDLSTLLPLLPPRAGENFVLEEKAEPWESKREAKNKLVVVHLRPMQE